MEYELISSGKPEEVKAAVNALLKEDWQLYGETVVSIALDGTRLVLAYTQAMTKETKGD